jgi:hypothetical protein
MKKIYLLVMKIVKGRKKICIGEEKTSIVCHGRKYIVNLEKCPCKKYSKEEQLQFELTITKV